MPAFKKQKSVTGKPVVTLHHFFAATRENLPRKHPTPLDTSDLIVIDSEGDSDNDVVEITDPHSSLSRLPRASDTLRTAGDNPLQLQNVTITASANKFPSFGVPSLLLDTTSVLQEDEPSYPDSPMITYGDLVELDGIVDWGTCDDELLSLHVQGDYDNDDGFLEDTSPPASPEELEIRTSNSGISQKTGHKNGHESNDAFSMLMSSFRDREAWKEASKLEDKNIRPSKYKRRKAPFYKVLQGMPIAVDAFRYGTIPNVTAYFLTHAHSDHYTNLSSSWKSGPIYCSEGTANLILYMLRIDKKWVHPLPMDVPTIIPDTGGVHVTLIEANHCPGSCLFYFEGPQTVNAGDSNYKSSFVGSSRVFRYLHCGDFRASPNHVLHPAVKGKRIDHVYLDTTYLDPKYTFPPQPLVVSACADLARRLSQGQLPSRESTLSAWMKKASNIEESNNNRRILFIVGTYSIGKERIVKAIAHALKTKVYCEPRKAAILRCQGDNDLNSLLISDPLCADVHLLPLGMVTSDKLKAYFERYKGQFKRVIGFRPTGWTYTQPADVDQISSIANILSHSPHQDYDFTKLQASRQSTFNLQIYPVPYSEHSSFFELTCFAMSLKWEKMIATVNVGSETSRVKMAKWITQWEAEQKKRGIDTVIPYRQPDYW